MFFELLFLSCTTKRKCNTHWTFDNLSCYNHKLRCDWLKFNVLHCNPSERNKFIRIMRNSSTNSQHVLSQYDDIFSINDFVLLMNATKLYLWDEKPVIKRGYFMDHKNTVLDNWSAECKVNCVSCWAFELIYFALVM